MVTRILIAEDHRLVADGYRSILEAFDDLSVVGHADDGDRVLEAIESCAPDLLLLDLSLPGKSGLDLLPSLRPLPLAVVVVAAHAKDWYVRRALELGAGGYVLKRDPARELVAAIRAVRRGERFLSSSIPPGVAERGGVDPYDALGEREREVLHLVARGWTTSQIANHVGLSVRVVEDHRRRARKKLGIRNQSELVQLMVRRQALDPDLV